MQRLFCDEALLAADLTGRVVIITGATSGIGRDTAVQLSKQGAQLILACRSLEAGHDLARELGGGAEAMHCDVSTLASVRTFAEACRAKFGAVHVLINNAGVMNCPYTKSADGFELQLATNYLGPFLLTELLAPLLEASGDGRVLNISSANHDWFAGQRGHVDLDDLHFERRQYNGWAGYSQSKLAQILHARELARRRPALVAVALHPGSVCTNVTRHMMPFWSRLLTQPLERCLVGQIDAWAGIQTGLFCVLADKSALRSGAYYSQHRSTWHVLGGWPVESPNPEAHDDDLASRLWEHSTKLVGLE
jgi:NAD(P)-dependent dehydrogenase (short-subunit alcohol dehydrogenase family)